MKKKLLSLVVPVYYEEECIDEFIKQVVSVVTVNNIQYEIVFIDDGSTDKTVEKIIQHASKNDNIKLVQLSYNHGKQLAVTAGIAYARGDYLLYMDPDLQDPPQEIPRFFAEIQKGYDVVYGIREDKCDTLKNKLLSKLFWYVLDKFTGLNIPHGLAVMRIFNRKFADQFLHYKEQSRFIEGIFMHIGMRNHSIQISQQNRFAGVSKFRFSQKMKLAMDAIFDFSDIPLKATIRVGIFFVSASVIFLIGIVVLRLFFMKLSVGWPSIVSLILFAFGVQIFFLGVCARYIGNIYKETKARPLFSVKDLYNLTLKSSTSLGLKVIQRAPMSEPLEMFTSDT